MWDPNTLVTSYRQLQELRPYYSFLDADVDRYTVTGVYRETMLSPRELNIDGLPTQAQTWVNQHITYTHGFGVAMSAVNQVTSDGSPDFLVQDIPPQSVAGLEIQQPRIYYGERGTGYSLVKTKDKEFDYPGPNGDVYDTTREAVASPSRRCSTGSPLRSTSGPSSSSRRRPSRARAASSSGTRSSRDPRRRALPHARPRPVHGHRRRAPVVGTGRVHDHLAVPVSTPQGDVNYLRNSVKIVIDAYNGTMKYYVFDPRIRCSRPTRPRIRRCSRPRTRCRRRSSITCGYPEDLFNVQAETVLDVPRRQCRRPL